MRFARYATGLIRLHNDRISEADARRQEEAAAELLQRFDRLPGVILADEVGMGKTFVALAAAVSILIERGHEHPVVVMTPPSLANKWPKDFAVFCEKCLDPSHRDRFRAASAHSGVGFLRLLDDNAEKRYHLIFLTHGALHRSIGDGLVKLAVIKRAFKGRSSLQAQRDVFGRFAGKLLGMEWLERRAPGLLGDLAERPYEEWRKTMLRYDPTHADEYKDDPAPRHLVDALEAMSGEELKEVVAGLYDLPRRDSDNISSRLTAARQGIAKAMEDVWKVALRRADFHSPLLILDEAHHVKNPATKLAGLFATEESAKDSEYVDSAGPLGGKFDRMLFLTATPFQLGHVELIRVIQRFEGIDWKGAGAPALTLPGFNSEIVSLGRALDDAQAAALRLDRSWGRLTDDKLVGDDGAPVGVDDWWASIQGQQIEGVVGEVREQVGRSRDAMIQGERLLSPWVLRYLKDPTLPGSSNISRRRTLDGAAIVDGGSSAIGLDIPGSSILPFLLAGRAQGLLASTTKGRALFAEGLASSFEAYLDTKNANAKPEEDDDGGEFVESPELDWYLEHLDRSLPRGRVELRAEHPKIQATAARAVALWSAGEKVLVFCHYRATGRALRQHISLRLHREILRLAGARLPGMPAAKVQGHLDRIGTKFFDDDDLRDVVSDWVRSIIRPFAVFTPTEVERIDDVIRRFIRTPSFLVRYMPLDGKDLGSAFMAAVERDETGQQSLRQTVAHFCRFLAERCIDVERAEFLDALGKVQTGSHSGKEVRNVFDAAERGTAGGEASLLPNVRLANGEVRAETRRRLLLTFNTPLFPEILIASTVMAEGVDLHLNCRYVIHHDLCWNPSTLEQRSGRVDRIGCKAERVQQPINLYFPYIAATQDEKMFRVVRDRERWFQIIMGEKYDVDEASTDRQAARVPLPVAVQKQLTMRLHPSRESARC